MTLQLTVGWGEVLRATNGVTLRMTTLVEWSEEKEGGAEGIRQLFT